MSEIGVFLENQLERQNKTAKEIATAMGIPASLLSQFMTGVRESCRPVSLMRIAAGISDDSEVQAKLLEAYFRDQCTPRYKRWIKVEPEGTRKNGMSDEPASEYGSPLAAHAAALRELRMPNDLVRALTSLARAGMGHQQFRVVIEDLAQFAEEDLLNR